MVDLFNRHAQHDALVNRLRQSFAEQVPVVEGPNVCHSIAFADAATPKPTERQAVRQLSASCALILTALEGQRP